ncbi:MAG: RND efflux system, inner membrane transporter, partial [uncultured Phycisphaerae bacterium]
MLSIFFIRRPVFACVISLLIVLLGAVSYFQLPVEQYPELAPPVVRVEALYPGASSKIIADTIASPLEQEINGVDRMIYMSSTSSDGRYQLEISFEPGTNVDMAAVLVQNRVNIAQARLPEEVRRQGVTTRKQSTALVGVIAVWSPDGTYDDLYLSNYLGIYVRDEVARIEGVGSVNILPAKDYGMRVWLDPGLLKGRNLTVAEVTAAIRAQNVAVAAGAIGREPAPAGTDVEFILDTRGRLDDAKDFAEIIVKTTPDGGIVRVKDVGRVELGTRDYTTLATFNGKSNAVMPIYQLPGANLSATAARVDAKLQEIKRDLPAGVQAKYFYDSSMFIRASLKEVTTTLVEAFVLVALVVLVFLQSWRSTLIPLITIPVALVGTFAVMNLMGFSINMLTMFGIVLAIGIVVDDAIVVVENVERNLAEGLLTPPEATAKSMGEITGAIVAITLVLMSVFLPAAALPGITGQMYRQFALTIAAATALSALNALTLSPALCALLLKNHGHAGGPHVATPHAAARPSGLRRVLTAPARGFNRAFDAMSNGYARLAGWTGRAAAVTMLAFVGVVGLTVWLAGRVPSGFVPNEDLGFVVVSVNLPDGATLQRTKGVVDRVSVLAREVDGVEDVVTLSGFSVLDGQGSSYGNAWIVLKQWDERAKNGRSVDVIMDELRGKVAQFQECQSLVFSLPAINGLGNTSGFDLRLLDRRPLGRDTQQAVAQELIDTATGQPQIMAAFTSFRAGVPQLYLDIDREKVMRYGVPLEQLFAALQTHLGSAYVNDFNLLNRTFQVNVQADAKHRLSAEDVLKLEVRNAAGNMVPLASLIRINPSFGPERITRYNLYPSATVNGIPSPGTSSGQAMATMESIAARTLPPGMDYAWSTMSFQERQVGNSAVYAFGLAVLLVYLILAAQYESWTLPLAVVLSVPLVATGAFVGLQMAGLDNNVFTQIGLVLLVGLGAKNAILIVEFARENRARGVPIVASAVEAARTRFRPILMTSFAFILGVLPLVIAQGAGAASRRSLGTAVFAGMIGATVLGLLFVPALYVAVQWASEKLRRPPVA